jgi:hypothetical protein
MWSLENRDIQKNKGNDGNDDEEKEIERGVEDVGQILIRSVAVRRASTQKQGGGEA